MKRIWCVLIVFLILSGCGMSQKVVTPGLRLREKLLKASSCSFDAVITADYGDKIYTFRMRCETDASGNMKFRVTEPESIAGIEGKISADGAALTFDDQVLAFETIADGQITPVSAPWLVMNTLRSGYIRACETKKNSTHLIYDDSYRDGAMQVDIYLSKSDLPVQADIMWESRRFLSLQFENFQIA